MKSFSRIIILGIALTLIAGNFAIAQNTSEVKTFTISGRVGPGIGGVEMRGLPDKVVTDENGYYSVVVPYGWTGKVTPAKAAYKFEPSYMAYATVDTNRDNQNYKGERITLTISGSVGLVGVVMNGLPGNPVTDLSGSYNVSVPFGWAGNVTPQKEGFTFSPPASR